MGISVIPAAAGGGIKLVQRGNAASAGNITITAVDTTKAYVTTFSSASTERQVQMNHTIGPSSGSYGASFDMGTNFIVGVNGAYLSNSTTLVATGACRWEVVEFA